MPKLRELIESYGGFAEVSVVMPQAGMREREEERLNKKAEPGLPALTIPMNSRPRPKFLLTPPI